MFKPAAEFVAAARARITEISVDAAAHRLAGSAPLLIDVREPDEYRAGHLAGAVNIPRGMLEFRISNEPALQVLDRAILLYCKTSGRGALAALTLQDMGFTNVASLAGGFDTWVAAGQPVVEPKPVPFG